MRPTLATRLDASVTAWAERSPDAIAIESSEPPLAYAPLSARADALAATLATRGVRRGHLVAVVGPPGPSLVVGMLAALRAGAAFVVFGAADPPARVAQALAELQPAAVVATGERPSALPGDLVDERSGWLVEDVGAPVAVGVPADSERHVRNELDPQAAYVALTSGSTGAPKGVLQTHEALLSWVRWQADHYGIEPGHQVVQLAPPGFDVAYCEIFGALCFGATLAIPPPETRESLVGLARWLSCREVRLLQMVPSHVAALVGAAAANDVDLSGVEQVAFVGEALAAQVLELAATYLPTCRFSNIYGPTEAVAATCQPVDDVTGPVVPVGYEVAGRVVSICRPDHTLSAPGEPGEICIAGSGVALGYMTGAEGRPSPFCELAIGHGNTRRHYHTGDRGRRDHDGRIEFLGRQDRQVKLRGQRVELGEIEIVLAQHPGVTRALVELTPTPVGSEQLVAFIEADPGHVGRDSLRAFAASRLPSYMVPQRVRIVRAFPRNSRGKTDVAALRAEAIPDLGAVDVTPGDGARPTDESLIAEVRTAWTTALGIDEVSDTADFHELGGDSLLAMDIAGRLRQRLGRRIPLRWIFERPTVLSFSRALATDWERLEREPLPTADG